MIAREPLKSILVLHDQPEQLRGILESEHQTIDIHYARNTREVEQNLKVVKPDACFSISSESITAAIMRAAGLYPSVRWFHVGGSGVDKMLPWCSENATMTNGEGVLARHLAETVLGAILAMNNNYLQYQRQQSNKQWLGHHFKPLCDQTLLIVGLGAVGRKVADNAKALGMRVIATKRTVIDCPNVDALFADSELSAVVDQADFITLHLSLSADTRHLIDAPMFNRMKNNACLINTARGGIVDEKALIEALRSTNIKAAFFDVFQEEPLSADSPLWAVDNLIITPHVADGVFAFEKKYLQFFSENVQRWNNNQALLNQLVFC